MRLVLRLRADMQIFVTSGFIKTLSSTTSTIDVEISDTNIAKAKIQVKEASLLFSTD